MDLERVKNKAEEIEAEHLQIWEASPLAFDIHTKNCKLCQLLALFRDLIEEVKRLSLDNFCLSKPIVLRVSNLEREKAELEAQVCIMREALEQIAKGEATGQTTGPMQTYQMRNVAKQTLSTAPTCSHEAQVCVIRELYDLHQSNRPDLPLAVRAKIAFRMEELFQATLSSTPTCPHKEDQSAASLVGTPPVICEGCGWEVNPDYGKCRRCE